MLPQDTDHNRHISNNDFSDGTLLLYTANNCLIIINYQKVLRHFVITGNRHEEKMVARQSSISDLSEKFSGYERRRYWRSARNHIKIRLS